MCVAYLAGVAVQVVTQLHTTHTDTHGGSAEIGQERRSIEWSAVS
jgi:hypothetical protein